MSKPNGHSVSGDHTVSDGYDLIRKFGPDSPLVAEYIENCPDRGVRESLRMGRILAREMSDDDYRPQHIIAYAGVMAFFAFLALAIALIIKHSH